MCIYILDVFALHFVECCYICISNAQYVVTISVSVAVLRETVIVNIFVHLLEKNKILCAIVVIIIIVLFIIIQMLAISIHCNVCESERRCKPIDST